jgi:methylated-DNA-[protein]-cysteine S-methyltransferase
MTTLRHETSLGVLLLTATREEAGGTVLVRVTFADTGRTPAAGPPELDRGSEPDRRFLRAAAEQIDEYLSGARTGFDLPLAPGGTPFRRTVWQTVSAIPHGTTRTYRDVALAVGRPDRIRAVGSAIAANPLLVVVPCHRVVGSDGTLVGYAGGLDRKRRLLGLEAGARQTALL